MNNMNQMSMHGNMPPNAVAGAAPNIGMHMSPAGAMMQQQPGGMMAQQTGGMMQQQPGGMIQQQPGGMIQQQPGGMMQQQPGAMMPQQPGTMMQQPSPQQMQQASGPGPGAGPTMPQQPPQDKMDNISKVKSLMGSLRECIPMTLKSAAQVLHQNHAVDTNSQKAVVDAVPRFDKNLEEFFSLCDQMELHLRTAITCTQQAQSASHYLPLTVIPSRLEPASTPETTLSYPTFLNTVRLQISYAKDIHDTLVAAAQNISPTE